MIRYPLLALVVLLAGLAPARGQLPAELLPPPAAPRPIDELLPPGAAGPLPYDGLDLELMPREARRPPLRSLSRDSVTAMRSASRDLERQMERLKREAGNGGAGAWRALSYDAQDVTDTLGDFQDSLRAGLPRADLYISFGAVENKVRALARTARASDEPAVSEALQRVQRAEGRLRDMVFAFEERGAQETWDPRVVERTAQNLVLFARDLERQGEWSFVARPGRRALQDDLNALSVAAATFRRGVLDGLTPTQVMRDFASVEDVWARVAPALGELTSAERLPTRPRAERVDDAIVRLHRRLGLPGETARLNER
jgi:hypothetical protein